jgi:hypothetical protein
LKGEAGGRFSCFFLEVFLLTVKVKQGDGSLASF